MELIYLFIYFIFFVDSAFVFDFRGVYPRSAPAFYGADRLRLRSGLSALPVLGSTCENNMADVRHVLELCKVFPKDTIVGVERHFREDVVVLTFTDRGVLVYNLQDQKLVSSWSVKQKQKPTCAAVCNPGTQKYIMVLDKTEVCSWSDDLEDLQQCQTMQVEKPVFRIHLLASASHDPVIIFQDGSALLLSQSMMARENKRVRKHKAAAITHKLLWSCVFENQGLPYCVTIASQGDRHCKLTIARLGSNNQNDSSTSSVYELVSPCQDAKLITCCLQEAGLSLITYWSDGSLCISDVGKFLANLGQKDVPPITCEHIQRIEAFVVPGPGRKKGSLAMTSIDSSHICLCGSSQVDGEWQDVLTIWNTKYGILQAWHSLTKLKPESSDTSSPAPLSRGADHTLCTSNFICAGLHQRVVVCPYTLHASSLASSLGKLAATTRFSKEDVVKPGLIVTPKLAKPGEAIQSWSEVLLEQDLEEQRVLKKLTDPQLTPTLETFSEELEEYIKNKRCKDVGMSKEAKKKTDKKHRNKDQDESGMPTLVIPQHFVTSVLTRCLNETAFWPRESLSTLLRTKCVPCSSSAALMDSLMERSEVDLLQECFDNIKGIPASSVVASLQFILRLDDSVLQKHQGKGDANMTNSEVENETFHLPVSKQKARNLCTILSYPVNDVFLQDSLKKLDFQDVMLLMKVLLHLIKSGVNGIRHEWGDSLQYTKVFDWANLLLGAHYTQLVLMPEAHELVVTFHQAVHEQIQTYEKLQSLKGFLDHYKKHELLPNTQHMGLYNIETIEL